MTPRHHCPEGSPQLDETLRSKERAALDIAVRDLVALQRYIADDFPRTAAVIRETLDRIAALVPEAVPQRNPGEPQ